MGTITSEATIAEVLSDNVGLRKEAAREMVRIEKAKVVVMEEKDAIEVTPAAKGKLVTDEEVELGHVSLPACTFFCWFPLQKG